MLRCSLARGRASAATNIGGNGHTLLEKKKKASQIEKPGSNGASGRRAVTCRIVIGTQTFLEKSDATSRRRAFSVSTVADAGLSRIDDTIDDA